MVGDDWAVKKWSKYHIRSRSDGASAMPKPSMLTTGRIGADPDSLLEWISTYDYRAAHDYFSRQRQPSTGNGYQRPLNSKGGLMDVNPLASGVLGYVSNSLRFCASTDGSIKLEPVKRY